MNCYVYRFCQESPTELQAHEAWLRRYGLTMVSLESIGQPSDLLRRQGCAFCMRARGLPPSDDGCESSEELRGCRFDIQRYRIVKDNSGEFALL